MSTTWCPRCGSEYRQGMITCSDCGVPLVAQKPAETQLEQQKRAEHSHDDIKTALLGRFDPLEAPVILQMLEEAGIFAMTRLPSGEPSMGAGYGFEPSGAGDIMVEAACVETARRLIDEQLPTILAEMSAAVDQQFDDPE